MHGATGAKAGEGDDTREGRAAASSTDETAAVSSKQQVASSKQRTVGSKQQAVNSKQ